MFFTHENHKRQGSLGEIEAGGRLWDVVQLEVPEPFFIASWPAVSRRGHNLPSTALLLEERHLEELLRPRSDRAPLSSLQLVCPEGYRAPWQSMNVAKLWKAFCPELGSSILVCEDGNGDCFSKWLHVPTPTADRELLWVSEAPEAAKEQARSKKARGNG